MRTTMDRKRRAVGNAVPYAEGVKTGSVLIIVLVVVAMLALAAYAFSDIMLSHREAATLDRQQAQARLLAESGADMTRVFLMQPKADREASGGVWDNAQQFRAITVVPDDSARDRGCFSILSPGLDDDGNLGGVRFGLEDESTRLNLNSLLFIEKQAEAMSMMYAGAASALGSLTGASATTTEEATTSGGRQILMALPGMSVDVADAILDWLDADDETRENGAERDYYAGLNPAYAPKNGPFHTVEELLLVKGVSPQLVFGKDVNRNGIVDPHEANLPLPDGVDNSTGLMDRGWSAYLTLFGQERNTDIYGQKRINLNSSNLETLYNQLLEAYNAEWATFIIAYRQNGPATVTVGGSGSPPSGELDFTQKSKKQFNQILDLIDVTTTVKFKGSQQAVALRSPFTSDLASLNLSLPQLMAKCGTTNNRSIPGRININQASRTVLMGIPGMTEEIVNEIVSRRIPEPSDDNPSSRYETWILCEGIVTLTEMKQLLPFVCAGGDVYRGQIVGYFQGGTAASRAEVYFDATRSAPRLLLWRDISHLGRGYALETLGVDLAE